MTRNRIESWKFTFMLACASEQYHSHECLCCSPDEFKFGCTSLRVPHDLLYQLRNDITVSPNGIAFVKVNPFYYDIIASFDSIFFLIKNRHISD